MSMSKPIADAFAVPPIDPRRTGCALGRILAGMAADDRKVVQAALGDRHRWTHAAISRRLAAVGHDVTGNTVGRHRSGECTCPK